MKIQVTWEMFDIRTEREFERGNEFEVNTVGQAVKWIRDEIPKRETLNLTVDRVSIDELGHFYDDEGTPCNSRPVGQYDPETQEWQWN